MKPVYTKPHLDLCVHNRQVWSLYRLFKKKKHFLHWDFISNLVYKCFLLYSVFYLDRFHCIYRICVPGPGVDPAGGGTPGTCPLKRIGKIRFFLGVKSHKIPPKTSRLALLGARFFFATHNLKSWISPW